MKKIFSFSIIATIFLISSCSDNSYNNANNLLPYGLHLKTKSSELINVEYDRNDRKDGIWDQKTSEFVATGAWFHDSTYGRGLAYRKALNDDRDLYVKVEEDEFESIIIKGNYKFTSLNFHHAKKCLKAPPEVVATKDKYSIIDKKVTKNLKSGKCYFDSTTYKSAAVFYEKSRKIKFKRKQLEDNAFEFIFDKKLSKGYYTAWIDSEYWWFQLDE